MEKKNISERQKIDQLKSINLKKVLTIEDVALLTDLSVWYIYRLTSRREIPHFKHPKRVYFDRHEIEAWMLRTRIKTIGEIEEKH